MLPISATDYGLNGHFGHAIFFRNRCLRNASSGVTPPNLDDLRCDEFSVTVQFTTQSCETTFACSIKHVLPVRPAEKMVRPDAWWVITFMADLLFRRESDTVSEHIGNAVRKVRPKVRWEQSIALSMAGASPDPTACIFDRVVPKARFVTPKMSAHACILHQNLC